MIENQSDLQRNCNKKEVWGKVTQRGRNQAMIRDVTNRCFAFPGWDRYVDRHADCQGLWITSAVLQLFSLPILIIANVC